MKKNIPSEVQVSGLEAHLGYWLRFVSNSVSAEFARKVAAEGVTVSEWVVMRVLFDHNEMQPKELATAIGMTKGPVSRLIDRLLAKKLIARRAHASDGRAQIVRLTPGGRALVPKLAALADANDAEFFAHFSEAEKHQLVKAMRKTVEVHGLSAVPVE
ncbi:MarR family transcriptional regulator [Alloacidobacterium dinghuense]|uniref:MarR family transcriptional regulator n=1 Tax=Alloacidobacterium dinghuense TaxID=2763107 RepID=A0A7G8BIV2_9BACT|nr:MarR family transcriptional regulator [Alloacidobacterium dinghuense]QNI32472.1 MarR family transcriptional regulator [Alloacidobacterium dinghuense]